MNPEGRDGVREEYIGSYGASHANGGVATSSSHDGGIGIEGDAVLDDGVTARALSACPPFKDRPIFFDLNAAKHLST